MFVKVVLKNATIEFDKEYVYAVPPESEELIHEGSCVSIPFGRGNNEEKGYVISFAEDPGDGFYVKSIIKVYAPSPMLDNNQISLVRKMIKKYSCSYGDAIRLMLPPDTDAGKKRNSTIYLVDPDEAGIMASESDFSNINQLRVVEYLLEYGESLQNDVMTSCQVSKSTFLTLKKKNIVAFGKSVMHESPRIDDMKCDETSFQLTDDQTDALLKMSEADLDVYNEFLLYGVTGSGKTEVYLEMIRKNLMEGHGSILLVPEISLTPQMTARLENRFGDNVRVLHSRLTASERSRRWHDVLSGKAQIVAGARSAVFAPVKDLKLVIIDEEQESTYKSETHPRYHASDIAKMRLSDNGGIVVPGSATPRIETYYSALQGKSVLLTLNRRIGSSGMADVKVVDMREELASGNRSIFSNDLRLSMDKSFDSGEKVMLFINRRGHSGFFLCRDCGHVPKCSSCSISMTYHSANNILVCHYCGKISHVPKICPVCRSKNISGFGAGTQKIEELCRKEFPRRVILRMDRDTTSSRDSHERILKKFIDEGDILIGTQMIAKGHDYPEVTTVGILAADLSLGMNDFRASERTFQLLTQAAGRAGRGNRNGRVIIQAYNVDDYSVRYAAAQDYKGFFEQEIIFRKQSAYPPFGAVGVVMISSADEKTAYSTAVKIHDELVSCAEDSFGSLDETGRSPEIMEAAKAPVYRIRDRFRFRIVIKVVQEKELSAFFERVRQFPRKNDLLISYDINPFQML